MTNLWESRGYRVITEWMSGRGQRPFAFQESAWEEILRGQSGLVNAPTGCGKTFSVFLGALIPFINEHPVDYKTKANNGLQLLWITPLRALAKDIGRAMEEVVRELGLSWRIGIRNGDTDISERQKQKRRMPEVLIITPESLHLLLAQKGYPELFRSLRILAVDEWHELLGSKRGVQVELAVSRIVGVKRALAAGGLTLAEEVKEEKEGGQGKGRTAKGGKENALGTSPALMIWGISATIGNLEQAKEVLLASGKAAPGMGDPGEGKRNPEEAGENSDGGVSWGVIVKAEIDKSIRVESILPDEIEKYPWAGHLGIKLVHKVLPILEKSRTTLIFINTRGMSETWYQTLLSASPDLAGAIALHHGSIDMELRSWVEESLHSGRLKAVVTTASLDLGVDFRPVDTVIQVGSPKGVARFLQRAGRSGHQPGEVSTIYFLPTHSLELVEAAALKAAMEINFIESREPRILCFDVLIQYLSTLAISDGFHPETLLEEVRSTYCFREMIDSEWEALLHFITEGGKALQQYDEFRKVEVIEGLYKINSRRVAMRHRLHIGTIVSDAMLKVKFMSGGYVGVIEEYFISRLTPGDVFTLAGRNLEFVMIKDMTAIVRKSNAKKSIVPSWNGGRMPLSSNLGIMLRRKLNEAGETLREEEGTTPGMAEAAGAAKEEVDTAEAAEATSHKERRDAPEAMRRKGDKKARGKREGERSGQNGIGTPRRDPRISGIKDERGRDIELVALRPLFALQAALSAVPGENELLIEQIETKDGFHLFVYPFEGRLVHEAMAALLAFRISRVLPITFSFAMNDYGFELLSDRPIPVDDTNVYELFSSEGLSADIQRSVNSTEMARRKFRDIAVIGGLIFQGYPGEHTKARHLQSSASLLFNVFAEYDPGNLLVRQAFTEVMDQQMEETRLRNMLERVTRGRILLTFPQRLTPFCFPLKVDSMRENLTSEKLEDRIKRMQSQLNRE